MASNLENLSALMDSELNEFELRRTLKRCDDNAEDAATWRRYHLARTLMREQKVDSTVDISSGVMTAIQSETTVSPVSSKSNSWSALTSMGIAASLTLAVMVGLNGANIGGSSDLASSGVLERQQGSSSLMRTSLASDQASTNNNAPALEVIRLSEGLRGQISEHMAMFNQSATQWQVAWLPVGFTKVSDRVNGDSEAQLFKNSSAALSVVVKPLSEVTPSEGAYTEQGVVAVGRTVDDYFVSVVGNLTLADADKIAASVTRTVQ